MLIRRRYLLGVGVTTLILVWLNQLSEHSRSTPPPESEMEFLLSSQLEYHYGSSVKRFLQIPSLSICIALESTNVPWEPRMIDDW